MNNKQAYDYSIDFIKGIAALSVILLHNMPNKHIVSIAWIGQAVPLFLLITSYLTYSSFERGKTISQYFSIGSFKALFKRVMLPFFVVTVIQLLIFIFVLKDYSICNELFSKAGIGKGSYYPWLHLQAWFFLPFIILLLDKVSIKKSLTIIIVTCIILEFLSCYFNINDNIYRLLFYRYLLVIYLGCLAKKLSMKINITLIVLAAISLFFSLLETYTQIDFKPFFIDQWKGYHWITSFYPLFVFILLRNIYNKASNLSISHFFVRMGKYSYEIFLCQMFVYSFIQYDSFDFIAGATIGRLIFIVSTIFLSIAPIFLYKELIKPKLFKVDNLN